MIMNISHTSSSLLKNVEVI